jgi:deazaflavin-dependent oxidoreductase (nitroreductase family)
MTIQASPSNKTAKVSSNQKNQKAPAFMIPFMKLPLIFFRLGIGWMFGMRFLRLTHVGRRSGKVYHTILAVLRFDKKTQEIFTVSPWSESNWYRNIQATPALEVETGDLRTGRVRYAPVQRNLTPEEIANLFIEFRSQRPIFSRLVARIPGWRIDSSYEEFLVLAKTLRGVAFQPKQ